ncbi:MAG: asparaginase domain-containing protein [Saprospiraceae bacterium]|nr:asparaginase domain-containing protein [Saprospiraceae bacterium]|tara:strand:+ start:1003 stop:1485 length:483 start_codon:yes stop_codon:yes gene_type:complete
MIRILATGGTFDKEYDEINGKLYFKDSHIYEILKLGRCKADVEVRTLMMIDSLEMTDNERSLIAYNCENSEEDQIIITHGTDTMAETALYLKERKVNKTIVLTGALIPYQFGSSDGLFNLGNALGFVQVLPKGVYVVMNGMCFDADQVVKNKKTGVFEAK